MCGCFYFRLIILTDCIAKNFQLNPFDYWIFCAWLFTSPSGFHNSFDNKVAVAHVPEWMINKHSSIPNHSIQSFIHSCISIQSIDPNELEIENPQWHIFLAPKWHWMPVVLLPGLQSNRCLSLFRSYFLYETNATTYPIQEIVIVVVVVFVVLLLENKTHFVIGRQFNEIRNSKKDTENIINKEKYRCNWKDSNAVRTRWVPHNRWMLG